MRVRRLLTPGREGEQLWVHLYGHPIGDTCAALLVAEDAALPLPGELVELRLVVDGL